MPELIILAGPNGAGKTTGAFELLPRVYGIAHFVNADEIARGLSPLAPERAALAAGRLMLERIDYHLSERESFAVETTLAANMYVQLIDRAHLAGYSVSLVFVYLHSPELAIRRVERRVASGGHAIPIEVIRRRYEAGLRQLFDTYIPRVEEWTLIDNSAGQMELIASGGRDRTQQIVNVELWNRLVAPHQSL